MIFYHSLIVAQWTSDFASPKARVGSAMVPLPGLSHPYQYERFLMSMDYDIGQPIKTDHNRLKVAHGKFGSVCCDRAYSSCAGKIWLKDH